MSLIDSSCETSVEKCSNLHLKTRDKPSVHLFVQCPLNLLSVINKAPGFCNVYITVTMSGVLRRERDRGPPAEKQFVVSALQYAITGFFQQSQLIMNIAVYNVGTLDGGASVW